MKDRSRRFPRAAVCLVLAAALTAAAFSCEKRQDYYAASGKLVAVTPALDTKSLSRAADRFRFLFDTYLEPNHMKPYVAIVPDKAYFLPDARNQMDYGELFAQTYAAMDYAVPIDLTPTLSADSYYATDSHWRQECLVDTANTLAAAMYGSGNEPALLDIDDYNVQIAADRFTGSDWRAAYSAGLPMGRGFSGVSSDTLRYLDSDLLRNMRVYNYETGEASGLYDMEKLSGSNAYSFFLSGASPILTIDNLAAADRCLVMFRDSYASSLAPLLAPYYRRLVLIDIRYVRSGDLAEYIDFSQWDGADALYLYSTTLLNQSITMK